MKTNPGDFCGTTAAVRKIGVSAERLRYWERAGIVSPQYIRCGTRQFRRYSQQDISRAITVKVLVDQEQYSLQGAIKRLAQGNRHNEGVTPS